MPRRRTFTAAALITLAAALGGCNEEHEVTHAETEGVYLTVGDLRYQVQISRIMNPTDPEDRAYFEGVAAEEKTLEQGEQWFGVFVRVENKGEEAARSSSAFVIEDTTGTEYEPVSLDLSNPLGYRPANLAPGDLNPDFSSISHDATTSGSVLLFKMPNAALENRPLELHIEGAPGSHPAEATVDLDV